MDPQLIFSSDAVGFDGRSHGLPSDSATCQMVGLSGETDPVSVQPIALRLNHFEKGLAPVHYAHNANLRNYSAHHINAGAQPLVAVEDHASPGFYVQQNASGSW